MLAGRAADRADRWWRRTPGPGALIVESPLWPDPQCAEEDLARVTGPRGARLVHGARCLQAATGDLMTAVAPEALRRAGSPDAPSTNASGASLDAVMERMRTQPPGSGSRSHAYVELHLEGSSVEPWSLPERSCVFGTLVTDPEWKRVYVVLKDTSKDPSPETTRTLLRLMLASGADD